MTPYQNRLTPITQRMAGDMKIRNLAQSTIDAYTYHVGKFAEIPRQTAGKSPARGRPQFPAPLDRTA